MGSHPIENIMATTMENIRNMVDVNTIVGDTVVMGDGTVIIPISKVSFGFVAGGGEYGASAGGTGQGQKDKGEQPAQARTSEFPFAGGTGAGVCISPMAFLVVSEGEVNLLPIQFNASYERILSRVPEVFSQIKDLFSTKPGKEGAERGEAPGASASKGSWFNRNRRNKFDENEAVDEDYRPPKDEL
jgi:sporulation protein YtfJ